MTKCMYYFIEDSELGNTPIKDTAIVLFPIVLSSKRDAKKRVDEIKSIIEDQELKRIAFQVKIEVIENYIPGFINQLSSLGDLIIGYGGSNKVNRFLLEQCNIDFLQDPHNTDEKQRIDFIHHFNSGLNQVLVAIMKQKGIGHIISVHSLHQSSKALGRVTQNIKLCRKKKVPVTLISYKKHVSAHALSYLGGLISLSRQEIKRGHHILSRKFS